MEHNLLVVNTIWNIFTCGKCNLNALWYFHMEAVVVVTSVVGSSAEVSFRGDNVMGRQHDNHSRQVRSRTSEELVMTKGAGDDEFVLCWRHHTFGHSLRLYWWTKFQGCGAQGEAA